LHAFPKSAMETLIAFVVTPTQNKKPLSRLSLDLINYFYCLEEAFSYQHLLDLDIHAVTINTKQPCLYLLQDNSKYSKQKNNRYFSGDFRCPCNNNVIRVDLNGQGIWINTDTLQTVVLHPSSDDTHISNMEIKVSKNFKRYVILNNKFDGNIPLNQITVIDLGEFPEFTTKEIKVQKWISFHVDMCLSSDGKYLITSHSNELIMIDLDDQTKNKSVNLDVMVHLNFQFGDKRKHYQVDPSYEIIAMTDDCQCMIVLERAIILQLVDFCYMKKTRLSGHLQSDFASFGFGTGCISLSRQMIVYFCESVRPKTDRMWIFDLKRGKHLDICVEKGAAWEVASRIYINEAEDEVYFKAGIYLFRYSLITGDMIEKTESLPLQHMRHAYICTSEYKKVSEKEKLKMLKKYY